MNTFPCVEGFLMEAENCDPSSRLEDYEVIEQIGRGSFSATFLVLHRTEKKKYVLKKLSLTKQTEKFKRTAHQEINLIAKLRHPYIVEYKDAWMDAGSCICIVTNYFERGNIYQIIRRLREAHFPEEVVCKWMTQLLLAIDFLHSNRVLHRDLKLSNIFVTKENDICLGDFGLAKLLDEGSLASSAVVTPNYMCPELLSDIPYGYKSDIWSLGCCVFEIAAHQQAFRATDMTGLMNKINRSLISPLPIIYSASLKQIIKSMLRKIPENRPTAAEVLRHSHLQPFLLRCQNPSPTFLPVKSPSPKSGNEKKTKPSPSSSSSSKKDGRDREMKKELLPLFDENKNVHFPDLLVDMLETKRVDPTSYSGKISTDSDDSKSRGTRYETCADNGDDESTSATNNLNEGQEQLANRTTISEESRNDIFELQCSPSAREDEEKDDTDCSRVVPPILSSVTSNSPSSLQMEADDLVAKLLSNSGVGEGEENKSKSNAPQRADALESLLELCAELLKQDKLDELTGILKPFGDETVSSRETAIWLTKTLINAKKMMAKES